MIQILNKKQIFNQKNLTENYKKLEQNKLNI